MYNLINPPKEYLDKVKDHPKKMKSFLEKAKEEAKKLSETKIYLAKGNIKLSKDVYIWSIPAWWTCSPTVECLGCYAMNAERQYKNAANSRYNNLLASLRPDFASKILDLIKKKNIKLMRIHESGDFYSQEYLDTWINIIKQAKNTRFLVYTRRWTSTVLPKLDFSEAKKLENLSIYYSYDRFMAEKLPENSFFMADPNEKLPKNTIKCMGVQVDLAKKLIKKLPKDSKTYKNLSKLASTKHYCGSICKHCWVGRSRIYIEPHGSKANSIRKTWEQAGVTL